MSNCLTIIPRQAVYVKSISVVDRTHHGTDGLGVEFIYIVFRTDDVVSRTPDLAAISERTTVRTGSV